MYKLINPIVNDIRFTIYFRAADILLSINFQDELRTNHIFLYFSNTINLSKLINIS